jgi:transposase-like protein
MVERLTGKHAISANQLAKETGVRQQILSRWLREARNLPEVNSGKPSGREWTVARAL